MKGEENIQSTAESEWGEMRNGEKSRRWEKDSIIEMKETQDHVPSASCRNGSKF